MFNTNTKLNAARIVAAVAALCLLAATCGSDETETVAPVTTDAPTTTDAPEATAVPTTTTADEQPEVEVVAEPEPVAVTATTAAPETEPEPEATETDTPDTTLPPEEPEPVTEPEPELVLEQEPTVTTVAPEPEISEEPTVTTVAPESEPEPTVTTVAPEPEPEPEAPAPNPSLSVEPFMVPYFGLYDFVLTGEGFTPGITIFLVVCTIPGDAVSPDTPAAELEAAIARVGQSDCDLANARAVDVGSEGSFTAEARGNVRAANFVWVASSADQAEAAAAPVFAEKQQEEPVVLQPGVWVAPEAGMVPPTFPVCAAPPYGEDCIPPSDWQRDEPTPIGGPNELPRRTPKVVQWANWCEGQILKASCQTLLTHMKQPLDYLGAHSACVRNEYRDRVRALRDGRNPPPLKDEHSWLNCATVIDPLLSNPPTGRSNDIGYRLSDTGISLAERCRKVLPEEVELESRRPLNYEGGLDPATEYGNDCDAWADYVLSRPTQMRDWPDCHASARLAEEWMEHYHGQPEDYYQMVC